MSRVDMVHNIPHSEQAILELGCTLNLGLTPVTAQARCKAARGEAARSG